jgi:hypothetical protein
MKGFDVQPKQPTDEIRQSGTMVGLTVGDDLLRPKETKRFGDCLEIINQSELAVGVFEQFPV